MAKKALTSLFILAILFIFAIGEKSFAALGFFARKTALAPINVKEKMDYVNLCWWNNFSDPYLVEYIVRAVECNHDTREASWKVEEYRQFVKYQFGQELPSLALSGYYAGAKFPDGGGFANIKNNIFVVPLKASYEADVFLKNRDKTKSSKKTYEASKFEEQSSYISLVTDVATVYFNIVKFDRQICLQQQAVAIEKEKLRREQLRFNSGVVSATDLNNSKKEYETSKNALGDFIKSREKSLNQLAVLIGDSPCNTCEYKRISFDKLDYRATMPCEISSDVVFSRPDILAAESKLQKANIDIRVARKEFLPKINLTGLYSLSNIGVDPFGTWQSTFAAIIAEATVDLFKGGMKIANLKINKSRYEQMFEAYRQSDLIALKEVNDSLIIVKQDTIIDANTIKKLTIQTDNYKRSRERYENGVISCPQLLTEKQAVIDAQQNHVNTKINRLIDYLTLYKSVGGKL